MTHTQRDFFRPLTTACPLLANACLLLALFNNNRLTAITIASRDRIGRSFTIVLLGMAKRVVFEV